MRDGVASATACVEWLRLRALISLFAQIEEVTSLVAEAGLVPPTLLDREIEWFFNSLGIDPVRGHALTSSSCATCG